MKGEKNMNKLLQKVAKIFLGLSMAAGVGVAVSAGRKDVSPAQATDSTIRMSERASTLGWSNGVAYTSWSSSDGIFTVTASGGGNNGKWYTSSGGSWRMYSGGTVTISCDNTYTISAVSSSPTCSWSVNAQSASFSPSARTDFTSITITYSGGTTPTPTTYTVTYDANGGTGTMTDSNSPYTSGSTVTVLTNTFTNSGYTFDHWNTAANDGGTDYDAGETFSISANTTLYAQWVADSSGGDDLSFSFTSQPSGWPTASSAGNYTYSGYTFALGANVYYNSSHYLMMKYTTYVGLPAIADKKLTKVVAQNSSSCSTKTYVGVSSSSSSASYITGGAKQNWSTTGSSYTYNLSGTAANTSYYLYITDANAQMTNLSLTYEATGGGGTNYTLTYAVGSNGTYDGSTTKSFSVAENTNATVKSPSDVGMTANTGYIFSTWNDGTSDYAPNSSYPMGTSDHTLTAVWVSGIGLSYNPVSNSGTGTGSMATSYVISGGTQTVASCTFTAPSGKVFDHWNTAADDSGQNYDPEDTIPNFTAAVTLYAIWDEQPVFELVTDATKLTAGTKAIFVAQGTYNSTTYTSAMVTERTTANAASTVVSATLSDGFNEGSVATATGATVYTLGGTTGAWTIKNGANQLGFTGTSNNNMKFNEEMTDTFAITSSGSNVSVISNTYNTRGLRYNVNAGSPRFSNYASGGQTAIYMFASIAEASFGTVDHIKVSHTPDIVSWHDGSTFSDSGLVVVAFDGANESTANSRLLETTEYTSSVANGTTFDDSDIGSKTITITYNDNTSLTDTYSVYVYAAATYELVESEPTSWAGNYLIVATVDTGTTAIDAGTYAFMSDLSDYDVPTNPVKVTASGKQITTGQEFEWSFASVTGGYSIQGKGGKYVGWENSSKNGMTSSDSALVNTISISGSDVEIANTASTTRYLSLSSSSGQFRYYTSGSVQLYKLVESSDVSDYADLFLSSLQDGETPVCNAGGNSDLTTLKTTWKTLADLFDELSNTDKQVFTQGAADESGDNVAKTLALYDYIASKYNTRLQGEGYVSNYNFMGRSITPRSNARVLQSILGENTNTVAIIVIISMVSVTAIGGYFFLRKRKENI